MPKDVAMSIETVIGQSVRSRSCRAEPAAPRRMPAAAKRHGRRQGEGPPTPVKMAEPDETGKKTPGRSLDTHGKQASKQASKQACLGTCVF